MITCKCIEKFRDKNNTIYGYRLVDLNGNTQDVKSENLKQAIKNQQIHVTNLLLTSDNRLVNRKPEDKQGKQNKNDLKDLVQHTLNKAKVMGLHIENINTEEGTYQLITVSPESYIITLPYNIKSSPFNWNELNEKIKGNIKIIGGQGLKSTEIMFADCAVQSLDISNLDTSNVLSMMSMFNSCKVQILDLSKLITSKVQNMKCMFNNCQAQVINLSNIDTSNVKDMSEMFYGCGVQTIDLSSLYVSENTEVEDMFRHCESKIIVSDPIILREYAHR